MGLKEGFMGREVKHERFNVAVLFLSVGQQYDFTTSVGYNT